MVEVLFNHEAHEEHEAHEVSIIENFVNSIIIRSWKYNRLNKTPPLTWRESIDIKFSKGKVKMTDNTIFIFYISLAIVGLLYYKKKYIIKYKYGKEEK